MKNKINKLEEIFWRRKEGKFVNISGKEVNPKPIGHAEIIKWDPSELNNYDRMIKIKAKLSSWEGSTEDVNAYDLGSLALYSFIETNGNSGDLFIQSFQFYHID